MPEERNQAFQLKNGNTYGQGSSYFGPITKAQKDQDLTYPRSVLKRQRHLACIRAQLGFLRAHSYPLTIYSWKHYNGVAPDQAERSSRLKARGLCFQQTAATHCPLPLHGFQNRAARCVHQVLLSTETRSKTSGSSSEAPTAPSSEIHQCGCAAHAEVLRQNYHNSFILPRGFTD